MGNRNWAKQQSRDRVQRSERLGTAADRSLLSAPSAGRQKPVQPSKDQLREQGAKALAEWQARQ